MANATDHAADVAEAVREIVAALTYTPKAEKRAARLLKIAARAEDLKPSAFADPNVVPLLNKVRNAARDEDFRRRNAIAALILQAVEAERKHLRGVSDGRY